MRIQHSIIGAFLLTVLTASVAVGQVPVQRVEDVGPLEQFSIVLERAFVPGLKILAPLYAYDGHTLICDGEIGQSGLASAGDGWAAIVLPQPQPVAYFHENVREAQLAALQDWCNSEVDWQFATPERLDIQDVELEQRYLSREIRRIAEQLR